MRCILLVALMLPGFLLAQANPNYDPDFDDNGCFTIMDILSVLVLLVPDNGGQDSPNAGYDPDSDGDGIVSIGDLTHLLTLFGTCGEALLCNSAFMDGYTYNAVEIGGQCWFAENLRTTTYRNGDSIASGLTDVEWTGASMGATAVYGEGSSACVDFAPDLESCDAASSLEENGRLYNWHAVNDGRGLCPAGWHVPSHEEWQELEDFLSSQVALGTEGNAIKTTTGWYNLGNGTDSYGFGGKPAGNRGSMGGFDFAGKYSYWWSSTPEGEGAWLRFLYFINSDIKTNETEPEYGFSVRCLQNEN